jgi:hypothetical protein
LGPLIFEGLEAELSGGRLEIWFDQRSSILWHCRKPSFNLFQILYLGAYGEMMIAIGPTYHLKVIVEEFFQFGENPFYL